MAKVLVVDDSLSVRKVVEKALEGRGMQVLSAASGAEALEQIERERPDVVICDVILPDKDGYQICQFVRKHPSISTTPVLLISGVDNGTVQARAAEVKSDEVMFKPFGVDELVRKIEGLLSSRTNGAAPMTKGAAAAIAFPPAQAAAASGPPAAPAVSAVALPTATSDASDRATLGEGLKRRLEELTNTPGVRFAVLADREGFIIETAGELTPGADEVAGALASCLAEASNGIGRELGQGQLLGTILEYESGTLLLHAVSPAALLAVLLSDPGALGKVRYYVRKAVPELARAL
jgi:DNA-binding response OmpR family regulator/predicted regulator of Ras-like GTPase activity (Roadblock/LC7/MglB family)